MERAVELVEALQEIDRLKAENKKLQRLVNVFIGLANDIHSDIVDALNEHNGQGLTK